MAGIQGPAIGSFGSTSTGTSTIGLTPYALKVTVVGSITYLGKADPGSSQSSAVWQCQKIDSTTGTVITWANGNANFSNTASDLTSLFYS